MPISNYGCSVVEMSTGGRCTLPCLSALLAIGYLSLGVNLKPGRDGSCPEWAMIELQGDLETRHPVPMGGKFIGNLHFTKKNVPILIIGHHILYGKVVELEKMFAVLMKNRATGAPDVETGNAHSSSTSYCVKALIKKKLLFKTRPKPIIAHVPKKL